MSYSYAVAYSVAEPATKAPTAAGRALAAALAAADSGEVPRLVLPVLLACSNPAVVTDFSQGEQLRLPAAQHSTTSISPGLSVHWHCWS
jgi:hypothetical protein